MPWKAARSRPSQSASRACPGRSPIRRTTTATAPTAPSASSAEARYSHHRGVLPTPPVAVKPLNADHTAGTASIPSPAAAAASGTSGAWSAGRIVSPGAGGWPAPVSAGKPVSAEDPSPVDTPAVSVRGVGRPSTNTAARDA